MTDPTVHFGTYHDTAESLADMLAELRGERGQLEAWLRNPIEVLLPSRGTAEAISAALLRRLDGGFAGVVLQTPETLARRIINSAGQFPRVATDAERRIAMSLAVAPALRTIFGIAGMLERTYRDIRDNGMTLQQFESRAARLRDRARAEQMIVTWRAYEEHLDAMRLLDPADLFRNAVTLLSRRVGANRQIIFGFYDTTGAQQSLIDALLGAGLVTDWFIPVPLQDDAPAPGYTFAAPLAARAVSSARTVLHAASGGSEREPEIDAWQTTKQEIREVCRAVRELLDSGVAPQTIAITSRSRSDTDTALLERFAEEFRLPFDHSSGFPLHGQRLGRALASLLSIAGEEYPRGRVIELIRDGLRLSSAGRHDADRLDFATRKCGIAGGDREVLQRMVPGAAIREPSLAADVERYVSVVAEIESVVDPLGRATDGQAWAGALRLIVERLPRETALDLAAAEAIDDIGSLLARAAATKKSIDLAMVADALRAASPLQAGSSSRSSVWYGDVMSLRGRSFDHVFVLGMQHDRFPQGRSEDPLLSDSERRSLGIREIGDGRAEERLLFAIVRDAARSSVRFSFALSDGAGRTLRPSHLLQQLAFEREADPARRRDVFRDFAEYLGSPRRAAVRSGPEEDEARAKTDPARERIDPPLARSIALVASSGSRSKFDGYLTIDAELSSKIRERLGAISATYLQDFGECPQEFLFRRLLRADELEEPEHEAEINALQKGSLDHTILERYYRDLDLTRIGEAVSASGLRLVPREALRLRAIIDEEFDRFDGERPPFNPAIRAIERRTTQRNLERFLAYDLVEIQESGFVPRYFEYSFGTDRRGTPDYPEGIEIPAGPDFSLRFHGIIDRIDVTSDGRYRVIDYKSGKAVQHERLAEKIDAGHRLQLALYAIAVQKIFRAPASSISGEIRPLRGAMRQDRFSFELAEAGPVLLENLQMFSRAILAGRFPAFPSAEGACRFCPMNTGCRTLHDGEESRERERYENAKAMLASMETVG